MGTMARDLSSWGNEGLEPLVEIDEYRPSLVWIPLQFMLRQEEFIPGVRWSIAQ
jgi:ABC-type nitrate/sulfonate/bicarbonate transport system permease component